MSIFHTLLLSKNMSLTAEGYLVCVDVPICRSGHQEYSRKELESVPGYQKSWDLQPDAKYKVYRPKDEVLHPDTIASFEGKTIVDTHPASEGNVVTIENERYLNCGHIQNVRRGPDHDGEVTLIGNIIIKDPDLKEKVYPILNEGHEPIRDVSCGYTSKLKRLKDKALVMYHLRGNHVAVVEKGRAGPRIAIKDSAPPEIKLRKENNMSWTDKIFGLGLKQVVADASPEELKEITKEMAGRDKPKPEPKVDAEPVLKKEEKEPTVDAKDPHRMAAHACLDRALDASKHGKGMSVDAHGKPANLEALKKELTKYLSEEEEEPAHQADAGLEKLVEEEHEPEKKPVEDAEEEQEEETQAEQEDKLTGDAKESGEHINDKGKSVLKAIGDSALDFIKASKPMVASIAAKPKSTRTKQEQIIIDSYNDAVHKVNSVGGASAYSRLAVTKVPEKITALVTDSNSVSGSSSVEDVTRFYEGVPYAIGKKRHQEYLDRKGNK